MKSDESRVRPTVSFSEKEHKKIKIFCVENDISLQDFLHHAAMYCLEKGIKPKEK